MMLLNPWRFWGLLLGNNMMGSLVGTLIIFAILLTLYCLIPKSYTWWVIGLFLVWIGPVLFILPLGFGLFILPTILSGGDLNLPVGCVRQADGKILCI